MTMESSGSTRQISKGVRGNEPTQMIRFVSLSSLHMVEDMDVLRQMLSEQNTSFDFFEFKIVNTTVQKRLIHSAQKNGPKERISVEEKVDINSNLKHLRQFTWRVLKDLNNVLLVQLTQLKGAPCSLPLIFPSILHENRQILVCGLTHAMRAQLLSKPDLKFNRIPELIDNDAACKEMMLIRADREKGMQSIARGLQDVKGLPKGITQKLMDLATGSKVILTDAEAINVILLSDIYSRYLPALQTFQGEIATRGAPSHP